MRLFIYGSLMRGESAHHLLGPARPLGPARTAPGHRLVLCQGFPGLVADATCADGVEGELYFLNDSKALSALDDYEDAPVLYARAPVALADGTQAIAWWLNAPARDAAKPLGVSDWRQRAFE